MKYGSFDRAIASSKLYYAEKYKKATMEDLQLFKEILGAEVVISEDGKRASITYNGETIDVAVV